LLPDATFDELPNDSFFSFTEKQSVGISAGAGACKRGGEAKASKRLTPDNAVEFVSSCSIFSFPFACSLTSFSLFAGDKNSASKLSAVRIFLSSVFPPPLPPPKRCNNAATSSDFPSLTTALPNPVFFTIDATKEVRISLEVLFAESPPPSLKIVTAESERVANFSLSKSEIES